MPVFADSGRELQLQWGGLAAPCFPVGLPLLKGDPIVNLFPTAVPTSSPGTFRLFNSGDFLLGYARASTAGDLTDNTFKLYRELLTVSTKLRLCRIWNFVPGINANDHSGQENYRSFCKGRSLAFESGLGEGFATRLPSASAVGTDAAHLLIAFVAHPGQPRHFENPLQIPAYRYPSEYGPRAPSFARATVVPEGSLRHCFVSGTAAIRGHLTIAPHETEPQLRCTLENLQAIMAACDMPSRERRVQGLSRIIKVYLRHENDLALVEDHLNRHLLLPDDRVSYLRSDICRADLNVEIEISALSIPGR